MCMIILLMIYCVMYNLHGGMNCFLDVVWSIGLPLELNRVISGFHSKSGTSVHFHCNSYTFHPEPCSTYNVLFVPFNSVTVTSHNNSV